jgi:protein involved in polysaccharide export with SLBB domain
VNKILFVVKSLAVVVLLILSPLFKVLAQSKVSQVSSSQAMDYYNQAKAKGMSDMQIEQAALAQGLTLSDIAEMRQKIEGNSRSANGKTTTNADSLTGPRKQLGKLSKKVLRDTTETSKELKVFGSDLFNSENLTFEPNLKIATPKNYQLGPDDEIVVDIYGNAAGNYRLKVSPDGFVKIPDIKPIFVSGLGFEDAKDKIVAAIRPMYSGLNAGGGTNASMYISSIRSIKVSIIGEVSTPGTYTISSLATAFNALYLCGGPTQVGSFRSIQIIRKNKIAHTIDIYDFLLKADQAHNVILQDQDIIYVPFYNTQVQLKGEVKREAIYELKTNEKLEDLLRFAGGFNSKAYKAFITVRQNTDKEQRIVSVKQTDFATYRPQSGDKITVSKISNRFENRILIVGAVNRPGEYALDDNIKTVKQLIEKADGLREDAFKNRAIIHREKDNRDIETVPVDLAKILSGEADDIELKKQDSLVVRSIRELRENRFVTILGEVNKTQDYTFEENMTVSDLVTMAGGFTEGAIGSRMEIARRVYEDNAGRVPEDQNVQIIEFKIDKQLSLNVNDAEFKLKPFDMVYIRKSPRYEVQKSAIIAGEVKYPGTYSIVSQNEKISSLIARSGGIKPTGYLEGAYLSRKNERVSLDIAQAVKNENAESNIQLENGDSLVIPERQQTVRIKGNVLNPSIVNFNSQYGYEDYLSQAGGYADRAIKRKVFVTYANGYTERTRHFLFFRINPKIQPGSVITIPGKPIDDRKSDLTAPVILSFTSALITAMVLLFRK